MTAIAPEWYIYHGSHETRATDERINRWLGSPPPWRRSRAESPETDTTPTLGEDDRARGEQYVLEDQTTLDNINAALLLRKPILVQGNPGMGKSSLAWSIAATLNLGPPLVWPISSSSTLSEGLYRYEAIAHLQHASRTASIPNSVEDAPSARGGQDRIGEFITLGPLGTALLPASRPRVLLVDEIDKASFDLPNDLLHVLEERHFVIPELLRAGQWPIDVVTWDSRSGAVSHARLHDAWVRAFQFPVVVLTSNGEREFSDAFMRRCVVLQMPTVDVLTLAKIASRRLGREVTEAEVQRVMDKGPEGANPTDLVLEKLYLTGSHNVEMERAARSLRRGDESQ